MVSEKPLDIIIVDDEPLARQALLELLRRDPAVRVTGEFGDGRAALEAIRDTPPDVVLLDIQMPVMDGLELVRQLVPPLPMVVFVTAYDRYAVGAFKALALDYLLKPCSAEELQAALERARQRLESEELADIGRRLLRLATGGPDLASLLKDEGAAAPQYLQRFTARKRNRTVLIQVEQIEWIEADDYCVRVHLVGSTHILRRSLKWFAEHLDPAQFIRVHRSAVLNLSHLREIRHRGGDDHVAVLGSGAQVPLSRAGREALSHTIPSV